MLEHLAEKIKAREPSCGIISFPGRRLLDRTLLLDRRVIAELLVGSELHLGGKAGCRLDNTQPEDIRGCSRLEVRKPWQAQYKFVKL